MKIKLTTGIAGGVDVKVCDGRQQGIGIDSTPIDVVHIDVGGQIAATGIPKVVFEEA